MTKVYRLSKSQYTKGVTCLKKIWLYNFKREAAEIGGDTASTSFSEVLFRQGNEVGKLAREFFAGGLLIDDYRANPLKAVEQTQKAIEAGREIIYEAAFLFRDILVRTDVLRKTSSGYDLLEVKGTSNTREDSGTLKDKYANDVALQKYVLKKSGLKLSGTFLVSLNKEYVRRGPLDLNSLFKIEDISHEIDAWTDGVEANLVAMRETLDQKAEPFQEVGSHCKNPYRCEFKGYCWKDIGPKSIHYIPRLGETKKNALIEMGITEMKDVPRTFKLTELQSIPVQSAKSGEPVVNLSEIGNYLTDLQYPIYYLDYETVSFAIPRYENTRPYQQIPFQYSLHIQRVEGGPVEHYEYLHDLDTDPRRPFSESLCGRIQSDMGSVVVYYEPFEGNKTLGLSNLFDDLEPVLSKVRHQMWDLHTPFQKSWYYDSPFEGSSSIKKVLPTLCPGFSYSKLQIQDGGTAMRKYMELIETKDETERAQIKRDLLEYCKLDSLAMAKIIEALQGLFETKPIKKAE